LEHSKFASFSAQISSRPGERGSKPLLGTLWKSFRCEIVSAQGGENERESEHVSSLKMRASKSFPSQEKRGKGGVAGKRGPEGNALVLAFGLSSNSSPALFLPLNWGPKSTLDLSHFFLVSFVPGISRLSGYT